MASQYSSNSAPNNRTGNALYPLIELIENEMLAYGVKPPKVRCVQSIGDFSAWFLESIVGLETLIAEQEHREPICHDAIEVLCRATLTAPTLEGAMRLAENFSTMVYRAGSLRLERSSHHFRFVHDSMRPARTRGTSLLDVISLFGFRQLFQWLTGGSLVPKRVCIGLLPRDDVLPILHLFNTPVLTGGDCCYLEYELCALNSPVTAQLSDFDDFFKYFPCGVFKAGSTDIYQRVSAVIFASAQRGWPIPTLQETARSLGYAASTFRRRLSREGHSFREIRDQSLRQVAFDSLSGTGITIGELADRLGFKDADTFRNAFHRWTNCAPSVWRATHTRPR